MKTLRTLFFTLFSAALIAVPPAMAQDTQSGRLTGTVKSADDLPLPGATVSVTSPALQGVRTTVTEVNGAYILRGLPPGAYKVTIEFTGMKAVSQEVVIPLGGTANLDVTLATVTTTEAVTVVAATPSILTTPTGGINLDAKTVDRLPQGRRPQDIAELAPGLTNNTPNASQITISGGFAYDNLFLINGVDVNDNLFSSPENVYIEDAIAETQVMTSGISAEYGRFSGGVVNIITKSGGNTFSGSFRTNFTNAAWTDETPFEKSQGNKRQDKLNRYFEGTLGGPIMRDRLWFFAAGRDQSTQNNATLPETNASFLTTDESTRYELKGTGTVRKNDTIQVAYTKNDRNAHRPSFDFTIDPRAFENPTFPSDLFVASWRGVLNNRLFATVQYSQKNSTSQFGGSNTDIKASPFISRGLFSPGGFHYNGAYFDATDPESRDNHQLGASLSYFLTPKTLGTHDLKAGFERFVSTGVGGNSQTPSGFVIFTDYETDADGKPVLDAQGRLIPVWFSGLTATNNWLASRGASIDLVTTSLYVHDRWAVNDHATLDLGVRYERGSGETNEDFVTADTNSFVPRLGVTYDVKGNGATVLQASYAHYAGKLHQNQFVRNTNVTNPSRITRAYVGPSGLGIDFAPGYDPANYVILSGAFPSANVFMDDGLAPPTSREFTVSAGRQLGARGVVRALYTRRQLTNFIEDFIDNPTTSGKTTVTAGGSTFTTDNIYYRNTDAPQRDYQGLQFQGNYRLRSNWTVAGHWTIQLQNEGNFEGENTNQPGVSSVIGNYPEVFPENRYVPTGRVNDFQRHKIRLWTFYNLDFGRFGSLDIAPLWRYNSGLTYSLAAGAVPLSAIQLARNPGYAGITNQTTATLYFGERGSETFPGYGAVDLGLSYQIPVWRAVRPWVKLELLNVLNNDKLTSFDTTVTPDPNSPKDEFGLPTGYIKGPRFGQGTANTDYPRPRPGATGGRTFLMSAGFRF
jgi:outer membrane receptor for ferrienterochelin and colicin